MIIVYPEVFEGPRLPTWSRRWSEEPVMRVRFLLSAHSPRKARLSARTLNKHFVYIVVCSDNSLYTGYAWNPQRRVTEHNTSKRGAKSLRGKLPVRLVYSKVYKTLGDALRREKEIKGWSRAKKLALINKNNAPALRQRRTAKRRE